VKKGGGSGGERDREKPSRWWKAEPIYPHGTRGGVVGVFLFGFQKKPKKKTCWGWCFWEEISEFNQSEDLQGEGLGEKETLREIVGKPNGPRLRGPSSLETKLICGGKENSRKSSAQTPKKNEKKKKKTKNNQKKKKKKKKKEKKNLFIGTAGAPILG